MWFMNHIFNAFVKWILQSPLHKMMSRDVLLIAFQGRKSDKTYITPVQYSRDGQIAWILVGFPEKKNWWRNLSGGVNVKLCIETKWLSGQALLLQGNADRAEILTGVAHFIEKFPAMKKSYAEIQSSTYDLSRIVMVKVTVH